MCNLNSHARLFAPSPAVLVLLVLAATVRAADPGAPLANTSESNDQKAGSVLCFNLYTSSAATPAVENSRISITNANPTAVAYVRLSFVNGTTGAANHSFICLTPNQTSAFLASEVDPGVRGYLVAVAVDQTTGCPINFNFLTGEAYVKLVGGHAANFSAEAVAAIAAVPASCTGGSTTATLNFDAVNYNQLPRLTALDKLRSLADGNSMLLILNRIGGNLATGTAATLGTVNGELINDLGTAFPFSFTSAAPQRVQTLSDAFPVTSPVFSTVITTGRSGWLTLNGATDVGLLGSLINFNANTAINAQAFRGGHNLRKLTLSATNSLTIPVAPPNC